MGIIAAIRRWFSPPMPPSRVGPMTPACSVREAADRKVGRPGRNEQDRLDEALEETLPTSDPVSIRIE